MKWAGGGCGSAWFVCSWLPRWLLARALTVSPAHSPQDGAGQLAAAPAALQDAGGPGARSAPQRAGAGAAPASVDYETVFTAAKAGGWLQQQVAWEARCGVWWAGA